MDDAATCPQRRLNAVTIDVEDWLQSTIDANLPLTDKFTSNTHAVLDALASRGVRGTFFVLGLAAEKAPALVRAIHEAGHEIQSHGYGHQLVTTLTPNQFRADLESSKKLLEDLIGEEIYGYRAPAFSITNDNPWALDVLIEAGFRYDSSVFPLKTSRYGIDGAPWYPHVLKTAGGDSIKELPVATYSFLSKRFPTGGGGYFRLLPYWILRRGVAQINRSGHSAAIYMHPYEYSPDEFREIDFKVPWKTRLHQGLGRSRMPARIDAMLNEFSFGSMHEVIESIDEWPLHEHRLSQR